MKAYIIVKALSGEGMVDEVNKWMKKGYAPQGGVSVITSAHGELFFQAMVLYK